MKFLQRQFVIPTKFIYQQRDIQGIVPSESNDFERLLEELRSLGEQRSILLRDVIGDREEINTPREEALDNGIVLTMEQQDLIDSQELTLEQINLIGSTVFDEATRSILASKLESIMKAEKAEYDKAIDVVEQWIRWGNYSQVLEITTKTTPLAENHPSSIGHKKYSRESNKLILSIDLDGDGQEDRTAELSIMATSNGLEVLRIHYRGKGAGNRTIEYDTMKTELQKVREVLENPEREISEQDLEKNLFFRELEMITK